MKNAYYSASVAEFLITSDEQVLGELARTHHHALEHEQRNAWLGQIALLKNQLEHDQTGYIFFEFSIPRMGKRADVLLLRKGMLFVIEFKVGASSFDRYAIDQVHD